MKEKWNLPEQSRLKPQLSGLLEVTEVQALEQKSGAPGRQVQKQT